MNLIMDMECNGLSPTRVWVVVLKDLDTGERHVFRHPDRDPDDCLSLLGRCSTLIGHGIIGFDLPVLRRLLPGGDRLLDDIRVIDTLVVSRLLDFGRSGGHGLASWGVTLGREKVHIDDDEWTEFSEKLVLRCTEDVEITELLFRHLEEYITSPLWESAMKTEHELARICVEMEENGFSFNILKAKELKEDILQSLSPLKEELVKAFPKRVIHIKDIHPKVTKYGTLNRSQFKWYLKDHPEGDLSMFNGGPFSLVSMEEFDPASPKQRIERLWAAGWQPVNKTKTHREAEKELTTLRRRRRQPPADLLERLERFRTYGWTVDEENLCTLPADAPPAAQDLVRWLVLSNRVSTLNSWIEVYNADTGKIHGRFNHIGAWTHRMSHDRPNLGNIPRFNAKRPETTPYSDQMRGLWCTAPDQYLVGVDAESIQLRIFAHYIKDQEFINALVSGTKEEGTDPHSLNQRALGPICRSRDDAKTFIYAWLLGSGIAKIGSILGCSRDEAAEAVDRFIQRYPGLQYLRERVIPEDAARGYFQGLDGRYVLCKGEDIGSRSHYMLAGYLQGGESIIMKRACIHWRKELQRLELPAKIVNFVHDEWQVTVPRDYDLAMKVATIMADSIRIVGEELNLACPMAGSVLNSHGQVAIGDTWMETH